MYTECTETICLYVRYKLITTSFIVHLINVCNTYLNLKYKIETLTRVQIHIIRRIDAKFSIHILLAS